MADYKFKDYWIYLPLADSKTGNGRTSTVQVRRFDGDKWTILARYRFAVGNDESRNNALTKAKDFIEAHVGADRTGLPVGAF